MPTHRIAVKIQGVRGNRLGWIRSGGGINGGSAVSYNLLGRAGWKQLVYNNSLFQGSHKGGFPSPGWRCWKWRLCNLLPKQLLTPQKQQMRMPLLYLPSPKTDFKFRATLDHKPSSSPPFGVMLVLLVAESKQQMPSPLWRRKYPFLCLEKEEELLPWQQYPAQYQGWGGPSPSASMRVSLESLGGGLSWRNDLAACPPQGWLLPQ